MGLAIRDGPAQSPSINNRTRRRFARRSPLTSFLRIESELSTTSTACAPPEPPPAMAALMEASLIRHEVISCFARLIRDVHHLAGRRRAGGHRAAECVAWTRGREAAMERMLGRPGVMLGASIGPQAFEQRLYHDWGTGERLGEESGKVAPTTARGGGTNVTGGGHGSFSPLGKCTANAYRHSALDWLALFFHA
jgi:hypothetical protein